jgi:hypothetical protein
LTGLASLGLGLLLAGLLKNPNQMNTRSGDFLIKFIAPAAIDGQPAPAALRTIASLMPSGAGMRLVINAVASEHVFSDNLRSVVVLAVWAAAAYLLLLWQLKRRQA